MRVVMLGWEFPPFIAGGLGVACYGLTRALDRLGTQVTFVLPRPVDRSLASHVRLVAPDGRPQPVASGEAGGVGGPLVVDPDAPEWSLPTRAGDFERTRFFGVPASFRSPYPGGKAVGAGQAPGAPRGDLAWAEAGHTTEELAELEHLIADAAAEPPGTPAAGFGKSGAGAGYRGDLYAESERYARLCVALLKGQPFDLIHAHDWLTFPAGQALARVSGKPLVVHVHSTEFDRSGDNINQRVYDIERRGMSTALRVLCVSELTKSIVTRRYGVDPSRIDVVYNGIDAEQAQPRPGDKIAPKDKIVLFLGRITMQKGPEYFIGAAKRVLEKAPDTKFIMAGAGDMELRMIELAAQLGIGHKVLFTGFLRGPDVDRVYQMADCYVMPSVSEPFGIAPLEAMRNDVPVIISKQSGVSEVLTHALKVDFWDTDEIANKIVAVLRHPPLGQTLRQHGTFELRRLTWEGAAKACQESYRRALRGVDSAVAV
jgi:glycogen(starch) synthase